MKLSKGVLLRAVALAATLVLSPLIARADDESDQTPPVPNDISVPGLEALSQTDSADLGEGAMPEAVLQAVRNYVSETRALGLPSRTGHLSVSLAAPPANVLVNGHAGDAIGETQAEVAVAVSGDNVVVGWNDSRGFVAGNTVTSYGYSTDGGATFTDGGNVPLAGSGHQSFGDPGLDTDDAGNWYLCQIYTIGSTQQNIAVHHGTFNGLGQLVWGTPVQASVGPVATSFLDKCLLAVDRVTKNVYVAYTRFSSVGAAPRIEVARSTTLGATWDAPVLLDNGTVPTASKTGARPFCGPNGEVYIVWEKGANLISCPSPTTGVVGNPEGQIAFSRSLDNGATFSPFQIIGLAGLTFMASGPGDLRERGNEFPDIAVDRSGGPFNGRLYVTWHEAAPWTANLSAGPVRAEAANAANNSPGGAEVFNIGENVTGSISADADLDYWQFTATQGQSLLFNLDPQGFNCGISGTSRGMRLRLFATQSPYPNPNGFPDSLLAASAQGAFAQRIVWTCPKTGTYLVRLQRSAGVSPFTYLLRVRDLTFGTPNPSRDARDVTLVYSSNQGSTWSAEQRINDDPAGLENRRPFIAADGLGHVHAFWHDSRDPGFGSNAALTSIYGTTSRDGGATWTPNYPVTDELSFFSFNSLAVPNLGDYNQAAAAGGVVHPAWSDQRISTGDVRIPNSNLYSAGLGPETYTTTVIFDHAVSCAANEEICTDGATVVRNYTITNSGTVPDRYNWTYNDTQGWTGGPINGTTAVLDPGTSEQVAVTATVPAGCRAPSSSTITFTATPVGAPYDGKSCTTVLSCPVDLAFDFTPNTLNLKSSGLWVTGYLEPADPYTADQIDVASIRLNGSVPVDADAPTALGDHDGNGKTDLMVKFNRAAAELTLANGNDVPVTVTGTVDGHCFVGIDHIRVIHAVVSAPAAGEQIPSGGSTTVRWQTPNGVNVQSVAILYSLNGGDSWELAGHGLPNSGSYLWSVPDVTFSDQAEVAVVLVESADETGYIVNGVLGVSEDFTITTPVGVGNGPAAELALRGVTPNPAMHQLRVSFSLKDTKPATLALYDIIGRQITSRRVDGLGAGWHSVDLAQGGLRPGVYVIRLTQDGKSLSRRAAFVR